MKKLALEKFLLKKCENKKSSAHPFFHFSLLYCSFTRFTHLVKSSINFFSVLITGSDHYGLQNSDLCKYLLLIVLQIVLEITLG